MAQCVKHADLLLIRKPSHLGLRIERSSSQLHLALLPFARFVHATRPATWQISYMEAMNMLSHLSEPLLAQRAP